MQTWLASVWDTFRTSFWFVPTLLTLCAIVTGSALPEVESEIEARKRISYPSWIESTPSAARSAMSAIAGAMVTVAGVVFSITIVGLTMTSQQYGPRLLRTFMANRITQAALGAFIATSLYCLLVLRHVSDIGEEPFVPHFSVSLGVALSVFCIGMLIYFNHAVAMSIQAPNVVASVAEDMNNELARLYPESMGSGSPGGVPLDQTAIQLSALGDDFTEVALVKEGYVQAVGSDTLLHLATSKDLVIKMHLRPGDYGVRGTALAYVWPSERCDDGVADSINDTVIAGVRRTPRQDIICAVEELVEVAVRALSPGVNDPFTAIACIDRLCGFLSRMAQRDIPNPFRCDKDGRLRVIVRPIDFPTVLGAAFNQIRHYGRDSVSVSLRLLDALVTVATFVIREEDLAAIQQQAEMLIHGCEATFAETPERETARDRYNLVLEAVEKRRSGLKRLATSA